MRRTITMEELDHFEVDESGQIYWKGTRIITEQRLTLPLAVNVAAVAAGIATVATAAISVVSYFWPALPHP